MSLLYITLASFSFLHTGRITGSCGGGEGGRQCQGSSISFIPEGLILPPWLNWNCFTPRKLFLDLGEDCLFKHQEHTMKPWKSFKFWLNVYRVFPLNWWWWWWWWKIINKSLIFFSLNHQNNPMRYSSPPFTNDETEALRDLARSRVEICKCSLKAPTLCVSGWKSCLFLRQNVSLLNH